MKQKMNPGMPKSKSHYEEVMATKGKSPGSKPSPKPSPRPKPGY